VTVPRQDCQETGIRQRAPLADNPHWNVAWAYVYGVAAFVGWYMATPERFYLQPGVEGAVMLSVCGVTLSSMFCVRHLREYPNVLGVVTILPALLNSIFVGSGWVGYAVMVAPYVIDKIVRR
jgi:hypothetical protein